MGKEKTLLAKKKNSIKIGMHTMLVSKGHQSPCEIQPKEGGEEMKFEGSEIRFLGFAIFVMSIMFAFFTFGMFSEHFIVMNLLFTMYFLGLTTTIGLGLMSARTKKKREKAKKNEGKK